MELDDSVDCALAKGLLLRTDPNVELPAGTDQTRAFDLIDWYSQNKDTVSEKLVSILRNWLSTGELIIPRKLRGSLSPGPLFIPINEESGTQSEIDALLKELDNPETRPRRRLEIGDQLAEIGDPRKGVGVKEYKTNNDELFIATPFSEGFTDEKFSQSIWARTCRARRV